MGVARGTFFFVFFWVGRVGAGRFGRPPEAYVDRLTWLGRGARGIRWTAGRVACDRPRARCPRDTLVASAIVMGTRGAGDADANDRLVGRD